MLRAISRLEFSRTNPEHQAHEKEFKGPPQEYTLWRAPQNALNHTAAKFKREPTKAEAAFWAEISKYRGWSRQVTMHGYVLDFYNSKNKLCVEIDGSSHKKNSGKDIIRDSVLAEHGIKTLRFTNAQAINNPMDVVKSIEAHISLESIISRPD